MRHVGVHHAGNGAEVAPVIETRKRQASSPARVVCVEVKLATRWERKWERPMLSLHARPELLRVDRMIGVYTGTRAYHFDGLDVLPVTDFLRQLHQGDVF